MKKRLSALGASLLALPLFAARPAVHPRIEPLQTRIVRARRLTNVAAARNLAVFRPASAVGLTHNLAVVGRLHGNGGVLYATAVDVQNNTTTDTEVDFFFDGSTGGSTIAVQGSFQNLPNGLLAGYSNVHYEDFIDALANMNCGSAPCITPSEEAAGVLGSMLIVYNNFSDQFPGQGIASARFYSSSCGGTIGVSDRSQEITSNNPLQLVGLFRDTVGEASTTQLYPNLFLNNMGFDHAGFTTSDADVVELTAYSSMTGQQVGIPYSVTLGPGQTASVSSVLSTLQIPLSEDTILVFAVVTSGTAAIEGLAVEVDNTTRDGSSIRMHAAEFY